jgi:hypothetical protein
VPCDDETSDKEQEKELDDIHPKKIDEEGGKELLDQ